MATASGKARCVICTKEKSAVRCEGCLQIFCRIHLNDHHQELNQQMDEIEMSRDSFRQTLNEQMDNPQQHSLIKQIDQWERISIKTIQQTAKECRERIFEHTDEHFHGVEINLTKLTEEMREVRQENDFNETDLNNLKEKLATLENELDQIPNISIEQRQIPSIVSSLIRNNTKWKQNGLTIAGGKEVGNQLDQLSFPSGIYVDDDDQSIYIADAYNHRIVQWKWNAKVGQVVAGGNGKGDRMDQLKSPTDVIVDKKTNSLIISDEGNSRVVRWPRRNGTSGQTIISNIACRGLAMDNNGELYVSDREKHEVRRWKIGETNGTLVAGGNSKGDQLNQFNCPTFIFVDEDRSVYVSDYENHRVMKWMKGAKEGTAVAGGQSKGDRLTQLNRPLGVIVDHLGNVYVGDSWNHRVMCWSKGSKEGRLVVGGNGKGRQPNQFDHTWGLSFDQQGHLYVVDSVNCRVQKFEIDMN